MSQQSPLKPILNELSSPLKPATLNPTTPDPVIAPPVSSETKPVKKKQKKEASSLVPQVETGEKRLTRSHGKTPNPPAPKEVKEKKPRVKKEKKTVEKQENNEAKESIKKDVEAKTSVKKDVVPVPEGKISEKKDELLLSGKRSRGKEDLTHPSEDPEKKIKLD